MFERIRALIGGASAKEGGGHERVHVATAALLLEMAHTDEEFHEMEAVLIQDLLRQRFELSEESIAELMQVAQQERKESLDLFQFARDINGNFSPQEKQELMETLWRIIYADGVLDKYEDYLVRKLATLLRLSHREMIEAKLKVLAEVSSQS